MVCCLTRERPGWWSRAVQWLEAAREELAWRLEPEPAVIIPMPPDRAREELNRRAEELLDRHGNAVLRYAYSYLHNMSDAEDILQDTLIKYMQSSPAFLTESHKKAWLLHVAANLSKNKIDYNKIRETDELEETLVAEEREDLSFVWEAVKALPEKYREVLHLYYQEGYPTKEISKILNRNESSIRSDLKRGREALKQVLKAAYDFE